MHGNERKLRCQTAVIRWIAVESEAVVESDMF
jgi:hypothetical protein